MIGRPAVVGCALLLAARVLAAGIHLDPADPTAAPLRGPSLDHPLGTDVLGRDLALRLIEAVQACVDPGLLAALIACGAGAAIGAALGWTPGGPVAALLRGLLDTVAAWPRVVVAVAALSIFRATATDPAQWAPVQALALGALAGVCAVPGVAAAVAERVGSLRASGFVEASLAHGLPPLRILVVDVLWANARWILLHQAVRVLAGFVALEASLSYLGPYGVPPPRPSWGNMLAELRPGVLAGVRLLGEGSFAAAIGTASLVGLSAIAIALAGTLLSLLGLADAIARRDDV